MFRSLILRSSIALALAVSVPSAGIAAGGGDAGPPNKSKTSHNCLSVRQWDPDKNAFVRFSKPVNGIWDGALRKCVRPDKTSYMDPDELYEAIRELAYNGRFAEANTILDQMPDQDEARVLTYRGFTARKTGQLDKANAYYTRAIAKDPDNFLARSYMGQGKLVEGDKVAAITQLREIQKRGGAGSWAEVSLRTAIETGTTFNY